MPPLLSEADLDPYFDVAASEMFRMEVLPEYRVDAEQPQLRAYLGGEPYDMAREPTEWHRYLRARAAEGITWRKVRVLGGELSQYERWECEWGFAASQRHGQHIHILARATADAIGLPPYDWWMFDAATVLKFHYDAEGEFLGAEELPATAGAAHAAWRDQALAAATPYGEWWASHPEHWRKNWLDSEPQQT